jgi:hypothetical protein
VGSAKATTNTGAVQTGHLHHGVNPNASGLLRRAKLLHGAREAFSAHRLRG